MAKARSQFVCQQCGFSQSQWAGKCPNCGEWNTLVETNFEVPGGKGTNRQRSGEVYKLSEIKISDNHRIKTAESELDNVLGGGLVAGMVVLIAGEPGIGKSTLLTQVALNATGDTLYICGEESPSQVAIRVKRMGEKKASPHLLLFESTDVDEIISKITEIKPKLVIVDSIQTLQTTDLTGTSGSVGQVRECAQRLTTVAKRLGIPTFMVGHATKEGTVAGPSVLMHVVDTVLWFEGERSSALRLIRAVKNRFGPTDQVGVFEMVGNGLKGVGNPSQALLSQRVKNVPGSVVSVILEGTRPLLVEIQALTSPSQLAVPRRVATGVDFARLQMLVAVLTQRANLGLGDMDIFVNVTSGIKLADRGADLAVCLAIASAFLNQKISPDIAAVGEVGLLGEVRKVAGLSERIKEAKKLGFRVASAESGSSLSAAIKKLLG